MTATSLHLLILLLLVHFFSFSQLDDIIHLFTTLNTLGGQTFFLFFLSRYWNQLTLFVTRLMFKASRFI